MRCTELKKCRRVGALATGARHAFRQGREGLRDVFASVHNPPLITPPRTRKAAEDAADDVEEVERLRADVINLSGSLETLRSTLASYYRALCAMESRFPLSKSGSGVRLSLAWYDAFRPTKRTEQASLALEKAAVLFNAAAVQSQIALACDRKTDAGLKDSARAFQEAAGLFALLKTDASLSVERPSPVDLLPETADMLEKLMLAQAQECVYEKALADGKSAALLARLACQVARYYDECGRLLRAGPL
ncbi:BRO1-like domain-containing protein, partial [Helicosporidium sp. ATCC 50920]